MKKNEFISKIQEMREEGECDLRTVIYFAEQLDDTNEDENYIKELEKMNEQKLSSLKSCWQYKERLKKLKQQGATVYSCFAKFVNIFPLKKDMFRSENLIEDWDYFMEIKNLFETKKEAEHNAKFGHMQQVNELSLPSFDKFSKAKEYVKGFLNKRISYELWKDSNNFITIRKFDYNQYDQENDLPYTYSIIYNKPLTEANYNEACELVRKLFKGEEQ